LIIRHLDHQPRRRRRALDSFAYSVHGFRQHPHRTQHRLCVRPGRISIRARAADASRLVSRVVRTDDAVHSESSVIATPLSRNAGFAGRRTTTRYRPSTCLSDCRPVDACQLISSSHQMQPYAPSRRFWSTWRRPASRTHHDTRLAITRPPLVATMCAVYKRRAPNPRACTPSPSGSASHVCAPALSGFQPLAQFATP
jgi:hypothetical protein